MLVYDETGDGFAVKAVFAVFASEGDNLGLAVCPVNADSAGCAVRAFNGEAGFAGCAVLAVDHDGVNVQVAVQRYLDCIVPISVFGYVGKDIAVFRKPAVFIDTVADYRY